MFLEPDHGSTAFPKNRSQNLAVLPPELYVAFHTVVEAQRLCVRLGGAQYHRVRGRAGIRDCCLNDLQPITRRSLSRPRRENYCATCRRSPRRRNFLTRIMFRVLIVQFLDAYALDVRSAKKTCIGIVHPDGRLIPFDTGHLFYRDDLERTRLFPLRMHSTEKRTAIAPAPLPV